MPIPARVRLMIALIVLFLLTLGIVIGIHTFSSTAVPPWRQPQARLEPGSPVISQDELIAQRDAGNPLIILDVRTGKEYASGHIPAAINIPIQELAQRMDELKALQDSANSSTGSSTVVPIVVYCERGVRANRGEILLQEAGIAPVYHLAGDMQAWRDNDRPVAMAPLSIEGVRTDTVGLAPPVTAEAILRGRGFANGPSNSPSSPDSSDAIDLEHQWIITAPQALQLVKEGAVLLDAQGKGLGLKRIPGAQIVSWQQFSRSDPPYRGNLLDDDQQLTQMFQDLGITRDRPVVVFANPPQGWGEDGRIVWMLRTLGHPQAVIVDGGVQALRAEAAPSNSSSTQNQIGDGTEPFIVDRASQQSETTVASGDWDIQQDELQRLIQSSENSATENPATELQTSTATTASPVLIDTREPREFAGETPYGEQRGGHIPGAVHLYFKDLLTEDGFLRPEAELVAILQRYGITKDKRAIAYCTGGIRSGWLTAVLTHYGYTIENYAGSMWEWSARPADQYPLVIN